MTGSKYQRLAMRTATGKCFDPANAALGLTGEAGEVADEVKKCLYQGREWDAEKIIEELGDVMWYVALMAEYFGASLDSVMEYNIDKLQKRYPDGFPLPFEASEKRGVRLAELHYHGAAGSCK